MTSTEPYSNAQAAGYESLRQAIEARTARVVVMGLGAVGLALVRLLLDAGFSVLGVDPGDAIVSSLRQGRTPMRHFPASWCADMAGHKQLDLAVSLADATLQPGPYVGVICVPTPLDENGQPDLSAVRNAAESLAQTLNGPTLVALESTTYPGTTRQVLQPILQAAGKRFDGAQRDQWLSFAPERVNPGAEDPAARQAPRLVGGLDEASSRLAEAFYQSLGFKTHATQTPEIAEAAKLVENVYRAVNIALVNELKVSLGAQGIDIWQVLDAAETKPFGFQRFNPGPGAGGSCIPVDPRYLEYSARQAGSPVHLVELAGQIDASMPAHVVNVCELALATQHKPLKASRILLLGVAYKPDVDIISESPALRIANELAARGAQVAYHDPHVPGPLPKAAGTLAQATSQTLSIPQYGLYDACILITDHSALPYKQIAANGPLIIDTRGNKVLRTANNRYFPA